ncbi:hypothetical protein Tsubulata_006353, partial [Turnera subulata]
LFVLAKETRLKITHHPPRRNPPPPPPTPPRGQQHSSSSAVQAIYRYSGIVQMGKGAAPAATRHPRAAATSGLVLLLLLLLLSMVSRTSCGSPESDALLKFKDSLAVSESLGNWNPSLEPCKGDKPNWVGVLCVGGTVWGLQLEHMDLAGTINVDALASLPSFRTLSLMDNRFDGELPDIKKLQKLKALYLSNNRFSGDIPDSAFEGMGSLKRLYLAHNEFTGRIPYSVTTLPKLIDLKLEGNQFSGPIPDFKQKGLRLLNLASNQLEGPIPESLSRMRANTFAGNAALCGPPLDPCTESPPPPAASSGKGGYSTIILIILILIAVLIAVVIILLLGMCCRRKDMSQLGRTASLDQRNSNRIVSTVSRDAAQSEMPEPSTHIRKADYGKLLFVREDIDKFDLQDLLKASAEVLGSGTFGASYKAVVMAQPMVVKRYRHMNNVGREEFHEHMRRLGRLKHPNLLPLVAYYYRKEEKLLVSEYKENGSLASHLHGNHSIQEHGLDWLTRLKIVKGIARGLAYLYSELPIIVPHGHLKSSNVLLDESFEPLLTDYALRPVINPEHAHKLMMAYKAPEYAQSGRTHNKTDIWCFGILVLEILTGKFPENYLTQGYNSTSDLATWVNNMVKEKKTSEVFDKEMMGTKNSKGEMISLLKIALSCCEEDGEMRLDIKEIVQKVEELKESDSDEEFFGSETNAFSVRGTDDDFAYNRR